MGTNFFFFNMVTSSLCLSGVNTSTVLNIITSLFTLYIYGLLLGSTRSEYLSPLSGLPSSLPCLVFCHSALHIVITHVFHYCFSFFLRRFPRTGLRILVPPLHPQQVPVPWVPPHPKEVFLELLFLLAFVPTPCLLPELLVPQSLLLIRVMLHYYSSNYITVWSI